MPFQKLSDHPLLFKEIALLISKYAEKYFSFLTVGQNNFRNKIPSTGGPQIVQILCSQGIVLLRNHNT